MDGGRAHPEALRIRDTGGATVEPAVLTWVLLAFDLFNETGELTLNRMFDSLERDHLAIAFTLLIRVAYGEHGLNSIIENGGGEGGRWGDGPLMPCSGTQSLRS